MAYETSLDIQLPNGVDEHTLAWSLQTCQLPWPWRVTGVAIEQGKAGKRLILSIASSDTMPPTDADLKALEERVPDSITEHLTKHGEMYKKFLVAASVCRDRIKQKLQEHFAAQEGKKNK